MIGRKFDYSLKVVVVGESGVGKTCLLVRFVRNSFDEESQSTLGVEFMSKIIQTQKHRIQLQLWDTAGQELFRSVTRGYYRGSVGALLLFDLSNRDTFDNIGKWLQDVRDIARPECVLALIGNKSDLDSKRQISREEAEEFAKQNSMLYFEVSAKTGENVEPAFDGIVSAIEKNLDNGAYELTAAADAVDFQNDDEKKQSSCC
ncbi:Ras-related protein Rab-14 [Tritrichomonas foetus]|uniref:Ras-related protein Rab-14 n=1 Tax=Tritrichomonas foetus TaxID=1144522 RepID=A0A1J4KTB4_9EUKA|nr:Ras-related protein Rab-14 [Tritrichomonas foetus]|eukprot:OHT14370.1 Ras-related protein Rab-14 [Tritrichomonas foetus]